MANDFTLPLREAIVTHLKNDGTVTAEVDAATIYGMRQPPDPWGGGSKFVRYGSTDASPRRAQCWDGTDNAVTLHVFSKAAFEDDCATILAALVRSLGDTVLSLTGGEKAHVQSRGTTIIPDAAEANAWHGIARFEATVS